MAQRQFRSDDTSFWPYEYGNSSDGAYSPSSGTDAPVDSACTGTINTTSLSATNVSFSAGQIILIHQTNGTGAGQWELNKISSYVAGTITTVLPLIYDYTSGAQVIVVPQYSSANIANGVTITVKAWTGSVGGIFVKMVNGAFTITGTLTGSGKGHGGGATTTANDTTGLQGDSATGAGARSTNANGAGGGGGQGHNGSTNNTAGAGGGNGTTGSGSAFAGGSAPGTQSTGGSTDGNAGLTDMNLGAGGGAGGSKSTDGGAGGNGGGIVIIIARTITITGSIANAGGDGTGGEGGVGDLNGEPGGGGSGGSILLKGQTITLGTNLVTAAAGTKGTPANHSTAGDGGVGRIHADYAGSISGSTTPTIDSRQDTTLFGSGGTIILGEI